MQAIVNQCYGGNKTAFAKAIGISPTSISNYLSNVRASKPSSDILEKIINCVGINPLWLLTGKGEMSMSAPFDETDIQPTEAQRRHEARNAAELQRESAASAAQNLPVGAAEPAPCHSSAADEIKSLIARCDEVMRKCEAMTAGATTLVNTASSIMNNAIQLNTDMKQDHADTKELYEKLHAVQQEHIAKSREYIEGSVANIKVLREDIRQMISSQTDELIRDAKENTQDTVSACKTADTDGLKDANKKLDSIILMIHPGSSGTRRYDA